MKPPIQKIDTHVTSGTAGYYRYRVMNSDGTPATDWSEKTKNLILPAGYVVNAGTSGAFQKQTQTFHAGTGSTPNSVVIAGTYQQTGTTVTRATGAGIFVSGNVDDFIKFDTGERAKIVSLTNSTTVVVDRSQTVAATGLTIYDTSRLYLDAWSIATLTQDNSVGFNGQTLDTSAGTTLNWFTKNFAIQGAAATYTEIGSAGNSGLTSTTALFSRVVLPVPVTVNIGQFLQLRFEILCILGNYRTSQPITVAVTGWPYSYAIQSIVSNGTFWDITVGAACSSHYAVGRPIIITGALPAFSAITSISSTVSAFTVTTGAAHGKIAGDSIEIAGSSVAGYNGTWTVLAAPTTTTLTVTSGANPGAATGGTLRLTTPGTWYNGTYTIASFPTSTTIRVTNATTITAAGIAGTITNSIAANAIITGSGGAFEFAGGNAIVEPGSGMIRSTGLIAESNLRTGMAYGLTLSHTSGVYIDSASRTAVVAAYNASTRSRSSTVTFASAEGVSQVIRQIIIGGVSIQSVFVITFDERQRKDNGFQLVLTHGVSWEPDLS